MMLHGFTSVFRDVSREFHEFHTSCFASFARVSRVFRAYFACFPRVSRVSAFRACFRVFRACFADSRGVSRHVSRIRGRFRTHCFAVSRIFHASFTHLSRIFHNITHYLRVVNPCNVLAADRVQELYCTSTMVRARATTRERKIKKAFL